MLPQLEADLHVAGQVLGKCAETGIILRGQIALSMQFEDLLRRRPCIPDLNMQVPELLMSTH